MLRNILIIRLKQLGRILKDIGPIYFVVLLIFLVVFGIFLKRYLNSYPNFLFAIVIIEAVIFTIHFTRKDIRFLKHLSKNSWIVYFVEYTIISIPFLILILFTDYWYNVMIIILTNLIVSNLRVFSFKKRNISFLNKFIPDWIFEWKNGVRKNFIALLLLYLIALGLSYYQYASLIFLWIMLNIIASFYNESEPLNVLLAKELSAKQFIRLKILSHLKLYLIVFIPILFVYSIFNLASILITIIFFILSLINFIFFILTKYSSYIPGYKQSTNTIYIRIALASIFVPILVPMPLIMCFRNYNKSVINLNLYLDAYNK